MQAYGRSPGAADVDMLRALERSLLKLIAEDPSAMDPQSAAQVLGGFAAARYSVAEPLLRFAEDALLTGMGVSDSPMTADEIADAATALADLGAGTPQLRGALRAALQSQAQQLSPRSAASAMWALAVMGLLDSALLGALARSLPDADDGVGPDLPGRELGRLHLASLAVQTNRHPRSALPLSVLRAARRRWLAESIVSDGFQAEVTHPGTSGTVCWVAP